jgi:hypothetical protein
MEEMAIDVIIGGLVDAIVDSGDEQQAVLERIEGKLDTVIEIMETPRPFLTTPFEDYTVQEGFNLLFLGCLVVGVLYKIVRRFV